MKNRKTKKSDLEGKKLIFFQLGVVIALLTVLYAFDFKSYEKFEISILEQDGIDIPIDFVIRTKHVKPPPVKKPTVVIKIDLTNGADDNNLDIDISYDIDKPVENWEPTIYDEPEIDEPDFTYFPSIKPSFPGGYAAMMSFLQKNMTYPLLAKEVNISGTVYVEFIIEKDGSITNIVLLREIGGGCDEEAIRVVSMMPTWSCGLQNGIPVRVKFTLPVKFSLL